jgi:hypothetical protein
MSLVSGHDHNLQYIEKDNLRQIISGAEIKSEAAVNPNDFSYGNGYTQLSVYENGAAKLLLWKENNKEGFSNSLYLQKKTISVLEASLHLLNHCNCLYRKQTDKKTFYRFL